MPDYTQWPFWVLLAVQTALYGLVFRWMLDRPFQVDDLDQIAFPALLVGFFAWALFDVPLWRDNPFGDVYDITMLALFALTYPASKRDPSDKVPKLGRAIADLIYAHDAWRSKHQPIIGSDILSQREATIHWNGKYYRLTLTQTTYEA